MTEGELGLAPHGEGAVSSAVSPSGRTHTLPTEDEILNVSPVCNVGMLTMVSGSGAGAVYRLGASCLVGRAAECQVRLDEAGVSRRHALIVREADEDYVLRDLGSRNRTTVRGQPIALARLANGDRIGFGSVFFRFTLSDDAEERALRQRYESSIRDGLTGAVSRRHFDERLVAEIAFAKRHGSPLSLLLLDVDHFKAINDEYGHSAGDAVLRDLAAAICSALRTEDLFARFGGEEFAVIARGISHTNAFFFGERMRRLVEKTRFSYRQWPIVVTTSIGVASLSDCREPNAENLVALADTRLYTAKAAGRNCCHGG